jgi:hypothetical protein
VRFGIDDRIDSRYVGTLEVAAQHSIHRHQPIRLPTKIVIGTLIV